EIQENDSEISNLEFILNQKELMETASSSSPFQRTNEKGYNADNSTGNIPRRRVYRQGDTPRMPIEEPIILQEGGSKGKILNIAAHDPQRWNSVKDIWKGIVVLDFIKNYTETDAETMYKYLEPFLGESTKALWEAYKVEFPSEF
ncbi:hypothetical protein, partial [Klebsiella pneumoniae]|uniref:hypothetical protein n=1 Tax=Klebsiella pneumoniae TaxID=573 RepID=UPI003A8648B8